MWELIKTNGTKLMYNSFQLDHPWTTYWSRNQSTDKQNVILANKLCLPLSYLLWHLLLPFVTSFHHLWHWFLLIVDFIFFCDNSSHRLINRMEHRQISYVSLHPSYCDICCYPLWHWFLHIVTFFFIVTIVFTNNEISCLSLWQSI